MGVLLTVGIILWDNVLFLANAVTPSRKAPKAEDNIWAKPEHVYVPPKQGDSRSPCPALNALCNHGIWPHDGRNLTFKQLAWDMNTYFNFAPSFGVFVSNYIADILHRDYAHDTFDLADIGCHNGIEHDGSLTRFDSFYQRDQGAPAEPLIEGFLSSIATPDRSKHLASYIKQRLSHSKATNPQFSLTTFHKFFAAANAATVIKLFPPYPASPTARDFLIEERLPPDYFPAYTARFGLTMARFNLTVFPILLRIGSGWSKIKKGDPRAAEGAFGPGFEEEERRDLPRKVVSSGSELSD